MLVQGLFVRSKEVKLFKKTVKRESVFFLHKLTPSVCTLVASIERLMLSMTDSSFGTLRTPSFLFHTNYNRKRKLVTYQNTTYSYRLKTPLLTVLLVHGLYKVVLRLAPESVMMDFKGV